MSALSANLAESTAVETCTIKVLPPDQWVSSAARAVELNPSNAPAAHMLMQALPGTVIPPEHLALLTAKYWGRAGVRLTVGFLDNPPADLRARILSHMNAWNATANVQFVETASNPQVRIARTAGQGYWSYLGTDILSIPANQQTMNLDSFSMTTAESEFHRVIRHETGHTLGFPHEHTRSEIVNGIDSEKAIAYFMATQGWSRAQVIAQVLTPLDNSALIATAHADPVSIMCYWLPASIMKNGVAVTGGSDIDPTDAQFAASVYPKFGNWQLLDNNPATAAIVAGDGNLYQLHKTGRIWIYTGTPLTGWLELDNNPATKKIAASAGNLYQIHNTGRIWKYVTPPHTGWQELDNNPASVDIVADGGDLYQLHNSGRIWKYTGVPHTGWLELDNNPATKKIVAAAGNLYQIHNTGRIWKYTGVPHTGWQELDNNPASVDIAAAGNDLYQKHNTGLIWKYTGVPHTGWQELDNNPATKEIAVGLSIFGTSILYQIHNTGAIWKYVGPPLTGWQEIDGNPASVHLAASRGNLYQLHNTGLIWRYTG
jgi:Astacin (Peptidase family M12A)